MTQTETKVDNGLALRLVSDMGNGKQSAMVPFIRLYKEQVRAIALANLIDRDCLDSVVNDVWLAVWHNANKFRGEKPVENWVGSIAKNKAISENRAVNRRHARGVNSENEMNRDSFSLENIQQDNSRKDRLEEIEKKKQMIISMVEGEEKTIITYVMEGESRKEIAFKLGISESNAKVKIHRIVKRLRSKLSGYDGADAL